MTRGHSNYVFAQPPRADIPRSTFQRNHGYKTTFDAGYLIPFYVDEALPGDTFNLSCHAFARLATPIVPIMDNLYLDTFFFAIPNRLIWQNWERFCGSQDTPGDGTDYIIPHIEFPFPGPAELSIYDYMGIPTKTTTGTLQISALPLRAYNLVYNTWFRDENICGPQPVPLDDGPDPQNYYNLVRRGKRHDYFTSCLPWPQKGPGVEIPLGGVTPVVPRTLTTAPSFISPGASGPSNLSTTPADTFVKWGVAADAGVLEWYDSGLAVNLADISNAATINDLRYAFQIQKMYERDARGGTRYIEILKSHFGVTSPDARLQRPEFLGGSSTPLTINPVAQMSSTDTKTPQGNLAAYGVVANGGNGFTKSFVEHTIILGLIMVRADMSYQQGLQKMWSRRTRFEFYWPALAHLGEQAVLQEEIYAGHGNDKTVFGYQERWAEYRYYPSLITGRFRSNATGSLDFWHLAQEFAGASLNPAFIEENPPVDRVVAVTTEPQFLLDAYFTNKCARPMPMYSVPGLVDHF